MQRIGLLSDTHSHLDEQIFDYFKDCDELWHAGDIGSFEVVDRLRAFKPLKAVYGNIDDAKMRAEFPLDWRWNCEGLDVWITHIGGYPGRYNKRVRTALAENSPNLFICGHSHILKVMPDPKHNLLHINPGACGVHGFHKVKTIVRFIVEDAKIDNLEVIELGKRGAIK
ncbi:MAG: metallophosphoesterase family protein [Bacteroidota bacterium]